MTPSTLETRTIVVGAFIVILLAWAFIGLGTGHMYLQYWRAPPAHFTGWAAAALSLSLVALAAALAVRLFDSGGRAETGPRWLFLTSSALAALALGMKMFGSLGAEPAQLGFSGFLGDSYLRQALDRPEIARSAQGRIPAALSWLKASCLGLIVVAVLLKLIGATKESAARFPAFVVSLSVIFGSPFLAWFSLELLGYIFQDLPSSHKIGALWSSHAAFALSMLVVLGGVWMYAGIAALVLICKSFKVQVVWKRKQVDRSLSNAF